jgi:hypothetical protein
MHLILPKQSLDLAGSLAQDKYRSTLAALRLRIERACERATVDPHLAHNLATDIVVLAAATERVAVVESLRLQYETDLAMAASIMGERP